MEVFKGKMVLRNACPLTQLAEKGECDEAKALPLLFFRIMSLPVCSKFRAHRQMREFNFYLIRSV